jgi:quinohemoprotein ethanol dehydrogenase
MDRDTERSKPAARALALALIALSAAACGRGSGDAPPASASTGSTATASTAAAIADFARTGLTWPSTGGDYSEQRFSPLTQIDKTNVGTLGLAWEGDLDSNRGIEATPIMVDGTLYVTSTWSRVMAFDAASGTKKWTYDPQVPRGIARTFCCDVVNRGVAVADGKVYVGTLDGRLVALDARSGAPVWTVDTVADKSKPYSITGAPRIVKGKVLIGNGGADRGVRGYLSAYDAATGKEAWRFWVVPKGPKAPPENDDVARAASTWPDDDIWTDVGGGTPWDGMAYDPELDLIYVGTGNGGSWKRRRPDDKTDNLYVASIVALHADTGRVAWHYQVVPGDKWDYTATNSIILADIDMGGRPRKVLFQAPKNGFFYVLDRTTGELLGADKYGAANWASRVDLATGRPELTPQSNFMTEDQLIYPNPNGAHDWHSMSFNPRTGLAYIPAFDVPWVYSTKPGFRYFYDIAVPAAELARMTAGQPEVEKGGYLRAWDVANRKLKWQVKLPSTWNGGTLSTAAGLVFQGAGDGYFSAYDAATGERLAHLFTGTSIMAAPITYSLGGKQYVAVAAGYGGSGMLSVGDAAAVKTYENNGRLLVFALGGGAVPTPAKRAVPLGPPKLDDGGLAPLDETRTARGRELYLQCAGCHGTAGSTGILPNLGRVRDLGKDGLAAILRGALEPNGMPNFGAALSDEDVGVLYDYLARGLHNRPVDHEWY